MGNGREAKRYHMVDDSSNPVTLLKEKSGNSIIREISDFTNEETAYYNFSLQLPHTFLGHV